MTMCPKDFMDRPDLIVDDSCTSSTKKRLRVSFSPHCRLVLYPMPSSRAQARSWYAEHDYAQFRTLTKETVQAAERGQYIEGEEMLIGLQREIQPHAESRMKRRLLIWNAVLSNRRADFNQSSEKIAALCECISRPGVQESQQVASMLEFSLRQETMQQQQHQHHNPYLAMSHMQCY